MKKPTFRFTGVNVFFLTGTRVLEPDLRHTLAEASDGCDSLKILPIGIAI